ncbi:MAG: hypothetical protein QOJ65_1479 [Fimbriimonadaceae bacterium]|jgi:hypothetical protein|nr:hypothetical protein [Fimbriimonadaceae bacterium]
MLVAALLSLFTTPIEPTPGHPVQLPTEYFEHRFIATPTTVSGKKLRLFTDSAGGLILAEDVAQQLGLTATADGTDKTAPFPAFRDDSSIPPPIDATFYLVPRKTIEQMGENMDGMLGQQWFGGRVWTFDYHRKRLLWRAPGDLPKHQPQHEAKLYFQTDAKGNRNTDFARIEATIDGETLSFLLDSGATNVLSDEALKDIDDRRPGNRATSFLAKSVYERWHAKHPEWKVITAKTMTGQLMLRVPKITLGGFEVGPVWFSVQQDKAFHQYMAQWMDQPTEGALGGSAFKYFRMTVDWPNALAVFERP